MSPHGTPRREALGFTLIELIVVVAIIAVLATVIAPSVFRHVSDAKVAAARSQIDVLSLALSQYWLDTGSHPSTEQGLEALRVRPMVTDAEGREVRNWRGPYLSRPVPVDPWGHSYLYAAPGQFSGESYDLYSLGRDGRVGGADEDADVTAWGGPVTPAAIPSPMDPDAGWAEP